MEKLEPTLSRPYEELDKDIDDISKEEGFYKASKDVINGVLENTNMIKLETGKRIIDGLWNEHKEKSLNFFSSFSIGFGFDFENIKEVHRLNSSLVERLKHTFDSLIEAKVFGIKIFRLLIDCIELIIELSKENIKECDEDGFDIDWENEYKKAQDEISRLTKEINIIRGVPTKEVEELMKMDHKIYSRQRVSTDEAIEKYVEHQDSRKKCKKIFEKIKEHSKINSISNNSRMVLSARQIRREEEMLEKAYKKSNSGPLHWAMKAAIDAKDVSSVWALSDGFYLSNCSFFKYACKVQSNECALMLLRKTWSKFKDGETPLYQALYVGNEAMAKYLICDGADLNITVDNKNTILHAAAHGSCLDIIKMMIGRGAKVDMRGCNGETPLHVASRKNFEAAKLLLNARANVNAKDFSGETPLHKAARKSKDDIMKLLIDKGADVDAKNNNGETPLQLSEISKANKVIPNHK